MNNENPNYYAIISANVRYDRDLTANAKLLYGEITALCNSKGYCWATNEYFAELYGVSKTSISKWIAQLVEKKYLSSHIVFKEGTKEILHRYLSLIKYPIEEKLHTPIEEKLKDNNTILNNTINNTNEYKKSASAFSSKDKDFKKEEPLTMPDETESKCQKPKKKKTEFEISCFNACKDVWFTQNPQWQFSGKDGTGIYSLVNKLKKSMEQGRAEITKESVTNAFEFFITNLPDNEFYKTADPTTLAAKYNSIFKSYKSLQNGTDSTKARKNDVFATSIFARR